MPDAGLRIVALHQTVERLAVDQIEKLGQHKSAGIHTGSVNPFKCVTFIFICKILIL